jgi:hypothetical protein
LLYAGEHLEIVRLDGPVVAHHADDGALGALRQVRRSPRPTC